MVVGLTAILRAMFVTGLLPWLLFVPVVLLLGLLAGRGAGIYSALLSTLLAALSIASPHEPFWLSGAQWLASLLFVLVAIGVVLLSSELRAAFRRTILYASEREDALARLLERDRQRELLQRELSHRMKNLLTIVQAVVQQTLRQSTDMKSASDAIGFRLAALGNAANILTASEWSAADLHSIADAALAIHDGKANRVSLRGPHVRFNSQVSMALALTFHELVTNAMKYGALSNDTGTVDLSWSVERGAKSEEMRFRLVWRESGGPEVRQPTRQGFGTRLIERSLRSYLWGDATIEYHPAGLVFRIDAPGEGAQV